MVAVDVLTLVISVACASIFEFLFFFKQKTAYEMRISDWSSDVCSSDLAVLEGVAFALADSLELIEQVGELPSVGRVSGGGAGSDLWLEIVASVQIGRASCRERVCQYV